MVFFIINQDLARPYQWFFQDTASPVMSAIMDLHSHIAFFLILVFIFVSFQIFDVLYFFRVDRFVFNLPERILLEWKNNKNLPLVIRTENLDLSPRISLPIISTSSYVFGSEKSKKQNTKV